MTTVPAHGAPAPEQTLRMAPAGHSRDRRGSAIPTAGMIATKVMELRKRRGLMIALIAVNIGLPAVFLLIRLLGHAFAPYANPPAGGDQIFVILAAGFLPTFDFIVAITVGCTAGSRDLTEGMFRHLVVTGRSRLALYLARIPAGLAIVVPLVAIGYTILCAVCVAAAPAFIDELGREPRRAGHLHPRQRASSAECHVRRPAWLVEVGNRPRPACARRGGSSGHQDRQEQLPRLHRDCPLPVDPPHDQDRPVDRA
jgi:hypothetical protein